MIADIADHSTPRRRRARVRAVGVAVLLGVTLFACGSEDEFDPAGAAERGIYEQIYTELELESEVTCQEPSTTVVGTTFDCHAEAEDGTSYDFVAEILQDQVIGTRLD